MFKFDFINVIMMIHSDKSAGGTWHAATQSVQLAMVLAISMTSTIPAPSTEELPSFSACCTAMDSYSLNPMV